MNSITAALPGVTLYSKINTGRHFRKHWQIWAWAAVLLLINLPLAWGKVSAGLIFIPGTISNGQWWQTMTTPLVHLSWYHLLLDAGGFILLYTGLEEKRHLPKAIYIIGPGAGALLLSLIFDPSISQQGLCGLSGIAHGLMAISALEMLREKDNRMWGIFSLAVVVVKSAYELWSGHVLLEFIHMDMCGKPLSASHAGGVIGGVTTFTILLSCNRMKDRRFWNFNGKGAPLSEGGGGH